MGDTIDNDLKGWTYASMNKATRLETLSDICSYVKKHKDTIRQFQIIKSIHVESLKS